MAVEGSAFRRVDAVKQKMDMGVLGVAMGKDDRLVLLQAHLFDRPVGDLPHPLFRDAACFVVLGIKAQELALFEDGFRQVMLQNIQTTVVTVGEKPTCGP